MSETPNHPEAPSPNLLEQALSVAPELANLAKEAWEGIGIQFTDAPTPEKKREAREALLAAYDPIDKLRELPDWVDDAYESVIDQILDLAFPKAPA